MENAVDLLKWWPTPEGFALFWLGATGLALFISNALEKWSKWKTVDSNAKFVIVVVLYILGSFGTAFVSGQITLQTITLQNVYVIALVGLSNFFSGEWYHNRNKDGIALTNKSTVPASDGAVG